jgi:hypothetical protein
MDVLAQLAILLKQLLELETHMVKLYIAKKLPNHHLGLEAESTQ